MPVPAERWTPERRRQLTRDALIDAAAQVFARRGFHAASLDEIAETAGFTRGAIYKNFEGKEDLLFAVNQRINERTLAAYADLDFDQDDPMDMASVVELWRDSVFHDTDLRALALEFDLYAIRNPEVRERAEAHRRAIAHMVAEFMRNRSEAEGIRFKVPIDELASILLIATDGFSHAAMLDPDAIDLYGKFLTMLLPSIIEEAPPPANKAKPRARSSRDER
jgi:AcrR family transcriptional regulator